MNLSKEQMWDYLKSRSWKRLWFSPIPIYKDPHSEFVSDDLEEAYRIEKARENENSNQSQG
jgi:hypothetical protein